MTKESNSYTDEVVISTSKPTLFKLNYKAKGYKRLLQKIGLIKNYKHLEYYPITLGQRLRYSNEIDTICKFLLNKSEINELDTKSLIKSLALLIHREESNPPKSLYDTIEALTDDELIVIVTFIFNSLQTESFLKSIILMTRMSLKTEEIIATEKDSTHGNSKEV